MPVEAACPHCEGKFRLPDAAAGKKIRCPKCKGPLDVPPLAAEPAAAMEPPVPEPPAVPTSKPFAPPPSEGLKSTWRTASQEPAPLDPPRVDPPRVETPKKPVTQIFVPPSKPKPPEPTKPTPPAPPAELWFLKGEDGETFGPVERPTLNAWHDEGRMTADSQLLQHGTEQWQWASDLYPDLEEPEPEPEPPAPAAATSSLQQQAETPAESFLSRKGKATRVTPPADEEVESDEELSPHSKPVAVLLGLTLGTFGIHRFYLGYVGIGLAMFFTLGGLFIWSITDSLRILFGHVTDSEGKKLRD